MKRTWLMAALLLAAGTAPASAQTWLKDARTWLKERLYVRADVGGGFGQSLAFADTNPGAVNALLGPGAGVAADTGNSVLVGGGFGIRINPLFRVDLTTAYLPSLDLKGAGTGAAAGFNGHASLKSLLSLGNVYLDLDGWRPHLLGPLQPYVAAGFGIAQNELGTATAMKAGVPLTLTGTTQSNFAWSLGAGVGYALTAHLTLDASYRYLNLGGLRTGTTATSIAGSAIVTAAKSDDLVVHVISLGLRYAF